MPFEGRLAIGLLLAIAMVYSATPLAIRVAARFDFYDNAAYQYGGQILEGRYVSMKPLSENSDLYLQGGAQIVLFGAVNSEFTGLTLRQYDYGPGIGLDVGLVEDTVSRWGVVDLPDGKVVWFELTV